MHKETYTTSKAKETYRYYSSDVKRPIKCTKRPNLQALQVWQGMTAEERLLYLTYADAC